MLSVAAAPAVTEVDDGSPVIASGVHVATIDAVALAELIAPHAFVTPTQYVVLTTGLTVIVLAVALVIGVLVSPLVPVYHWYDSGPVPVT